MEDADRTRKLPSSMVTLWQIANSASLITCILIGHFKHAEVIRKSSKFYLKLCQVGVKGTGHGTKLTPLLPTTL